MKNQSRLLLMLWVILQDISLPTVQCLSLTSKKFSSQRLCAPRRPTNNRLLQVPRFRSSQTTTTTTKRVPSSYLFGSSSSTTIDEINENDNNNDNDNDNNNTPRGNNKRDQFQALVKQYWDRLLAASLIPSLFAFGIGYKVAMTRYMQHYAASTLEAGGGTATAVLPPSRRPPIVLSTILILMVSREIWRNIPAWLKRQFPAIVRRLLRRQKKSGSDDDPTIYNDDDDIIDNDDDDDDLTSIWTIQKKLSSVSKIIEEKISSSDDDDDKKNESTLFLAMFKLMTQLKEKSPELRDERYKASGEIVSNPQTDLSGLDQAFEYADWAYYDTDFLPGFDDGVEKTLKEALKEKGYILVRYDKPLLPGSVSHYIAMNREKKEILVSVKGTSGVEDMLTDLCGQAVTHELTTGPFTTNNKEGDGEGAITKIRCHEGTILAARRLADDLAPLVEDLFLPNGYKFLLVGHSLGAGVAALCGLLLRSRFPKQFITHDDDEKNQENNRLQVLAFASPPVLDYDAAMACKSFCTTIVNNSDIIPRASVSNLIVTYELLRVVRKRLMDLGLDPKDWSSAKAFIQMLTGNTVQIMNRQDFEKELTKAQSKVELRDPDHLYCPGKVLHLFDYWSKTDYGEETVVQKPDEQPQRDKKKREEDGLKASDENETSDDGGEVAVVRTAESVIATDGTSKVLRWIEIDDRILSDHLSPSYRSSLRGLLRPERDTGSPPTPQ